MDADTIIGLSLAGAFLLIWAVTFVLRVFMGRSADLKSNDKDTK